MRSSCPRPFGFAFVAFRGGEGSDFARPHLFLRAQEAVNQRLYSPVAKGRDPAVESHVCWSEAGSDCGSGAGRASGIGG